MAPFADARILTPGYDYRADVWSLGIVICRIVFGEFIFPYNREDTDDKSGRLTTAILTKEVEFPDDCTVSPPCQAMIRGFFEKDPNTRSAGRQSRVRLVHKSEMRRTW
ncbi:hypothetical protein MPSEU_000370800 [Mayamaea pseudoterrestris]|nr:hypothetical protein MPSEU_000370800 [Mayamaea pseudoterrestris]